jgi:hypothetical protein
MGNIPSLKHFLPVGEKHLLPLFLCEYELKIICILRFSFISSPSFTDIFARVYHPNNVLLNLTINDVADFSYNHIYHKFFLMQLVVL